MFYLAEVEDHVRVEPRHFGLATKDAVAEQLQESYVKTMHKELGFVISVIGVKDVGEGIIIPGDGAAFYKSLFTVLVWKPELHELIPGLIKEITNFGAFMQIGPAQGMIHISQTMEDFVSLSKTGNLQGKVTKRSLNVGDSCLARVVAISYKAGEPKIGLTMRQPGLGKVEWLDESKKRAIAVAKKAEKFNKSDRKKGARK
ncbi:MAG TPA: DNA-directed RNA polymerase [Candidatus Nanoarchaeia archaeon]|nr:DNA-directed RNA polymerase [Candidatus Nanoarchaeia archaeon]